MAEMAQANRWRFWVAAAIVFVVILWLLNDILLPFVVGMAVAYFLDPIVARLQRLGLSRTWATTTVTILAVLLAVGVAMAILPPLFAEVQSLIVKAPQYVWRHLKPRVRVVHSPGWTTFLQRQRRLHRLRLALVSSRGREIAC